MVNEFLGSFGCNEYWPELTQRCTKVFLNAEGVSIPKSVTTYVAPCSCPKTYEEIKTLYSNLEEGYVMGLTSEVQFLAEPAELWVMNASSRPHLPVESRTKGTVDFLLTKKAIPVAFQCSMRCSNLEATHCHGLLGYFVSDLYDGLVVDTRPTSAGFNSFHWENFFFPLKEPINLHKASKRLRCSVYRCTRATLVENLACKRKIDGTCKAGVEKVELWYEWSALGAQTELPENSVHNAEGYKQTFRLNTRLFTGSGRAQV